MRHILVDPFSTWPTLVNPQMVVRAKISLLLEPGIHHGLNAVLEDIA